MTAGALKAVNDILRYISGCTNLGLGVPNVDPGIPDDSSLYVIHCDADNSSNPEINAKRRAHFSYAIGTQNSAEARSLATGPVSDVTLLMHAAKNLGVSVASTQFEESHAGIGSGENEIYALGNTIRDVMYFSYIIQESGRSFQFPFTLHVDAQVSTVFANTGAIRNLLHHIDQRQCWVAACRDSRVCVVQKVGTKGNYTDIGSKGFVSRPKEFLRQRDRLQVLVPSTSFSKSAG